eukprot:9503930-Pyramimonas_sp.AAC.2
MMKRNRITQQNITGEALGSSRCNDTSKRTRRMFTMPVEVASDSAVCASDAAVCGSADFEATDRHTDGTTASTRQGEWQSTYASVQQRLVDSLQGDIVTSFVAVSSARRTSVAMIEIHPEDEGMCWLCMEEDSTVERPCKCPRYSHPVCLARWQ